jgi:hypothetical protein
MANLRKSKEKRLKRNEKRKKGGVKKYLQKEFFLSKI